MALITIHGPLSTPPEPYPWLVDPRAPLRRETLLAGEALFAGSACYVASTGLVMLSATAPGTLPAGPASVLASFDGLCLQERAEGDPVTLFGLGAVVDLIDITSGITPAIGDYLWPAGTGNEGFLSDADISVFPVAGEMPICKVVSDTAVMVVRTH